MTFIRNQFSIVIFLLLFCGYQGAINTHGNEESFAQVDEQNPTLNDYRLPKTLVPLSYEILLIPDFECMCKMSGTVRINILVKESTNTITFHAGKIEITMVSVTYNDGSIAHPSTAYNSTTEKYEIQLRETLKPNSLVTVNLQYNGIIRDDMIGFYRSSYIDSYGNIKWLLTTQFQTTHARHAFPCFDEPSFKATFLIRILRPEHYTTLSNMPLSRTIHSENKSWDEFEQSIPMSTYLVAFVISDFESVKIDNFKVWTRPNAIDQAKYALMIGNQTLDSLSKRFNQNYQISKMDMVAVPDFSAGAMENWGLVTYRESRLLYDESTTSDVAKQTIASVIVHELTHMWFGNQVTPEWWSYLWLSEAFARYFQYFGTAQIETTWNMEEQFLVEQHQTAYAADGLETSQPMTRNIITTSQIGSVGDTITYNKGGSILRMMNLIFGSDVYDVGLQNYLNNSVEKVGHPDNLWVAIQNEVDRVNGSLQLQGSVKEIMTTWTEQPGFPVLTVSIGSDSVHLEQKRFLLRNLKATPTNRTWWIPITWATNKNRDFNQINVAYWLNESVDTIAFEKSPEWAIFNVQSSGFYRVNYDNNSWYRIFDALNTKNHQGIHVLNRAALVDDLLNLARAGLLNYNVALDGLRYLVQEENYLPFKAAFSGFTYLDQRFSADNKNYSYFKKFVLALIKGKLEKLGYLDRPGDDRLTILLRGELSKWACKYDHKECVQTFVELFKKWKEQNIRIKPNQQSVAYCMGVKHGTKEDWEFLWNQYYNSISATEQEVLLQALGCTRDATLLERYLLYALKDFKESRIRKQDNSAVFSAVSSSDKFGAEFVLDFVSKHYAEMKQFYTEMETTASILATASQRFSTPELVDKFDRLIQQSKVEFQDVLKSLNNSLEIAKYELQWYTKYSDLIVSWILSYLEEYPTMDYRLPTTITPNSYSISVTSNVSELDNFLFTGTVNIVATVTNDTSYIVLHSVDLKHTKISVYRAEKEVDVLNSATDKEYDVLIIKLDGILQVGDNISITIEYEGHLNEVMRGFYRSWYKDSNGNKRWLAATQMEPVGARKMFPCFDEPSLKATFTISVVIPETYRAISNMPVSRMYLQKNTMKKIIFEETPKMSTYLMVLVISDFGSTQSEDEVYSVWAKHDSIAHTKYALSLMKPLVDFYQEKLGFPYQLPKLDMIALPDFISGAMENWGLLTYKERNVLYDPLLSTTASKQSITNVISHEISHQWFGNLVTPLWWKYIWLNEGFARYFQYFATNDVTNGTWFLESQFVVDHLQSALEVDSAVSTHALTNDVESPTKIREMFDTITYGKGASVIRMIEKSIGHDAFYKGLQSYLRKRQYSVAVPEDLFDAFKDAITDEKLKNSIHDIMNSWTTQPGYPVVHAAFIENRLELSQERFLLNRESVSQESTWFIPITWTCLNTSYFNETTPKYWLVNTTGIIELSCDFYLLNIQQSGFYRVNYDTESWERIITWLKSDNYNKIHEINRAALIDDLFSLARARYVDYVTAFTAAEYLNKETSYYPWRAFFNHLPYLYKQLEGKDAFDSFKYYIRTLLTPIYEKLGFDDQENDDHVTQLFRSHVRKWACKFDIADCKARALSYLNSWNVDATVFPSNYHSVSYCTGAEQNDPQSWNRLWNYYLQSTFAAEKSIVLQSLACTTDKTLLNELLNKVFLNDSDIRLEDISGVFTSVIDASPEGIESAINTVRNRYEEINKYHSDILKLDSILNTIEKNIYKYEMYEKYTELITWLQMTKPWDNSNHAYRNLQWTEKHIPNIHQWLEIRYGVLNYRLPKLFTPLKYNISLSPYFEEEYFTFNGNVRIEMKRLMNYTSRIVVHSHELHIRNVLLYQRDSNLTKEERLNVKRVLLNENTQMLSIFSEKFIKSDEVILYVDFTGTLNDKMQGFYRSSYENDVGVIRWLATTHFEPTYARRAFPCFDEPALKAKFVINVERPKDYIVLSNMPREFLTPSAAPDRVWETFAETVEMSTYLVAFVVCDFEPVRNSYETIQVWGRPTIASKGDFANIAATRFLGYLASETGHEYTLPKLDLIGIPDFAMGAMENWGLVTFREYGLFYDKNVTTAKYLDYIITIIAHELSHMLYGNLVTCDWWEYIWLNEGFAEYMQWRLSHLFRPEFGFDDLFVVDELQAAMQSDGAHPMNNPVSKPSDIAKIFDTVTYGKSSSVIRMIQKSLRPEIFTNATRKYLLKHQYKTATPKDLWHAFDDEIKLMKNSSNFWNISMETLMDGWTNKPGYPVVSATLESDNTIVLTQKNFTTYKNIDHFWIPITLTTSAEMNFITTTTDTWLGGQPLTIHLKNPVTWFLLNIQQSGYYRVNYDGRSWSRLIDALKSDHDSIHVTNRAQIIDDLFNLAHAGHVHYHIALNSTTYLQKERNYLPWKAFFNGMNFILQRYEGQNNQSLVTKYMLKLTDNLYNELGFNDTTTETHFDQLNRELILTWACKLGNKMCINKSLELFDVWRLYNVNKISPNARPAVYCTAIKYGGYQEWSFLWEKYLNENLASEKQIMLNAFGCTNDNEMLSLHIQTAMSIASKVRRQDINALFASIYKTGKHGVDMILDFISGNYKALYIYYNSWDGLKDLISKLAPLLSTTDQITKMSQLKEIPALMSNYTNVHLTIESAIEVSLSNQKWYEQHSKDINTWLISNTAGSKTTNSLHIFLMTVFSIIVYIFNY